MFIRKDIIGCCSWYALAWKWRFYTKIFHEILFKTQTTPKYSSKYSWEKRKMKKDINKAIAKLPFDRQSGWKLDQQHYYWGKWKYFMSLTMLINLGMHISSINSLVVSFSKHNFPTYQTPKKLISNSFH